MHHTDRAFASHARTFTDGPADAPLAPCAHCCERVESVDSRGRCDDCAGDLAVLVRDELDAVSHALAVHLGQVSFASRVASGVDAWRVAA